MMNGTKKSDSSIVPAKPANKAERSTAELVEGDDGTKRNVELQSTVRTQSREAVTQAQARIRGAVTRNEKETLATSRCRSRMNVARNLRVKTREPCRVYVGLWPIATSVAGVAEVSCRRQSRLDLLAASITARDPEQTLDVWPPLRFGWP